MPEHHSIIINAHPNIYTKSQNSRNLRIEFSIPSAGVNNETGLLILVPGFGASIDSNIYIKMRNLFPDQFNLITIQCDYFGSAFMCDSEKFDFNNLDAFHAIFNKKELLEFKSHPNNLLNLLEGKRGILPAISIYRKSECLEEFNDMGYMQAIDIITAIEVIKLILAENSLNYDNNRIIGYGHSHGAYLLHLCNILMPNFFSFLIDNSAWLEPKYLKSIRNEIIQFNDVYIVASTDYLARGKIQHLTDLNLTKLYKYYCGTTQIISFQGDNDNLYDYKEKKELIESLQNSIFILIEEKDIDNKKYFSNSHGLDADFAEMFFYALEFEKLTKKPEINWNSMLEFENVQINISNPGLPVFDFLFRDGFINI